MECQAVTWIHSCEEGLLASYVPCVTGSVPIAFEWIFTRTSAARAVGSVAPKATNPKYRRVRAYRVFGRYLTPPDWMTAAAKLGSRCSMVTDLAKPRMKDVG